MFTLPQDTFIGCHIPSKLLKTIVKYAFDKIACILVYWIYAEHDATITHHDHLKMMRGLFFYYFVFWNVIYIIYMAW